MNGAWRGRSQTAQPPPSSLPGPAVPGQTRPQRGVGLQWPRYGTWCSVSPVRGAELGRWGRGFARGVFQAGVASFPQQVVEHRCGLGTQDFGSANDLSYPFLGWLRESGALKRDLWAAVWPRDPGGLQAALLPPGRLTRSLH